MTRLLLPIALSVALSPLVFATPAAADFRTGDVHVAAGQVIEDDLVTAGGDAFIEGTIEGDLVSMGGDVRVVGVVEGDVLSAGGHVSVEGRVEGDVLTSGGNVHVVGEVEGEVQTAGGTLMLGDRGVVEGETHTEGSGVSAAPSILERARETVSNLVTRAASFALVFLLALGIRYAGRRRYDETQRAMVADPVRAAMTGFLGVLAAIAGIVVLAITVIGIPFAVLGAIALCGLGYGGLAMSATVVGAALPMENLKGQEIGQIAMGAVALYLASMVPTVGGLVLVVATIWGIGALLMTRKCRSSEGLRGGGPYRTQAA